MHDPRYRWLPWMLLAVVLVAGFLAWPRSERLSKPPSQTEEHAGSEEAHADKTVITLSPEQVQHASIESIAVPQRSARDVVEVGGVVRTEPDRQAKVSARAAGRVVSLPVSVGARVAAGQTLAVLDSPEVADRRLRVRSAEAQVTLARRRLSREREVHAAQTETRGPVLEARLRRDRALVEEDSARRNWERARKMYPEVVSRRDYEAARTAYEAARAELRTAELLLANEERVSRDSVRVRAQTGDAVTALEAAEAELDAARAALRALGVGEGEAGDFTVLAPIAGTVTARAATPGEWMEAGAALFTVVDLSRVWAIVDIYEQDLQRIAVGQDVEVTTGAYPGRVFQGRLSFIDPMLEEHARTARGRVVLDNAAGLLRGEMFVRARIAVRQRIRAAAVPHAAVMEEDGKPFVYVEQAPGRFVRRPLRLGASQGEWYEVLSGLRPGERVVARGAFYLKSEQDKAQIGEDED